MLIPIYLAAKAAEANKPASDKEIAKAIKQDASKENNDPKHAYALKVLERAKQAERETDNSREQQREQDQGLDR